MLITANQPFGEWGKIFSDPAMTLAAVDRLVHHATIFEINVDSYRRRSRRTPVGRTPPDARNNQGSHHCRSATIRPSLDKIALALSSPRDNYHLAATAKMAILVVAAFPSRLSRYTGPIPFAAPAVFDLSKNQEPAGRTTPPRPHEARKHSSLPRYRSRRCFGNSGVDRSLELVRVGRMIAIADLRPSASRKQQPFLEGVANGCQSEPVGVVAGSG